METSEPLTLETSVKIGGVAVHDPGEDGREIAERRDLPGVRSAQPQNGNLAKVAAVCLDYGIHEVLLV